MTAEEGNEVLSWITGNNDEVKRDSRSMPVVGEEWYIISCNFLEKWKNSLGIGESVGNDQEPLNELDNSDIIDNSPSLSLKNEVFLRRGLELGRDYEIVPPKVWNYFKGKFPAPIEIVRKSIQINDRETQVEVNFKPLLIAALDTTANFIYNGMKTLYISHQATVDELIDRLILVIEQYFTVRPHKRSIKLWKIEEGISLEAIASQAPLNNFLFPGILLLNEKTLEQAEVQDNALVIVETKNPYVKGKCNACNKANHRCIACDCGKYKYCDKNCIKKDLGFHNCGNNNSFKPAKTTKRPQQPSPASPKATSKQGRTGLSNLGNTCFMNSGLQCLSNTSLLTEYFLSNAHLEEINYKNPLGTGGKLAIAYGKLLKDLWNGTGKAVSPWDFKKSLSTFARQFSGYQQHDSQEMLSFLLDGLHEDLNRILEKPYIEEINVEGLSEGEIGVKYWENHIMRNHSVIVDMMHGQYRSEVICPECNRTSFSFDPFLMVTLPIPDSKKVVIDIMFVAYDPEQCPLKIRVIYNRTKPSANITKKVARTFEIPENSFFLALVSDSGYFIKALESDEKYDTTTPLYAYEYIEATDEHLIILEQFKEASYNKKTKTYQRIHVSCPRILGIPKNTVCTELFLNILGFYFSCFGKNRDKLLDTLREFFPVFHNEKGENKFKLLLSNPSKKQICPYCSNETCIQCEIQYSAQPVEEFIEKTPGLLRIAVLWSHFIKNKDLHKISRTASHRSVRSVSTDPFNTPVPLHDCLKAFSQPEKLDEFNTSYCPFCKCHSQGIKKLEIYKLPQILIFHLKRFKQSRYVRVKDTRLVNFPIESLDMARHCLTNGGVYDLYAVSNHSGNLGGGHYTAFGKNPIDKNWYHFNDSHVNEVKNIAEIVSRGAYVLFYQLNHNF